MVVEARVGRRASLQQQLGSPCGVKVLKEFPGEREEGNRQQVVKSRKLLPKGTKSKGRRWLSWSAGPHIIEPGNNG